MNLADNVRAIKPLPPDVVAQIKSSTTVTSLTHIVSGLVQNSLDAGATKIEVSVDARRGGCTVQDDGSGIAPAEFALDGSLGKPYCKSRLVFRMLLTCRRYFETRLSFSRPRSVRNLCRVRRGPISPHHHIAPLPP
ncbi:hypothetical protein BKA80DRAFT_277901 [Phyllosticta citrichinensis]